jgi:hypothetical protein
MSLLHSTKHIDSLLYGWYITYSLIQSKLTEHLLCAQNITRYRSEKINIVPYGLKGFFSVLGDKKIEKKGFWIKKEVVSTRILWFLELWKRNKATKMWWPYRSLNLTHLFCKYDKKFVNMILSFEKPFGPSYHSKFSSVWGPQSGLEADIHGMTYC